MQMKKNKQTKKKQEFREKKNDWFMEDRM